MSRSPGWMKLRHSTPSPQQNNGLNSVTQNHRTRRNRSDPEQTGLKDPTKSNVFFPLVFGCNCSHTESFGADCVSVKVLPDQWKCQPDPELQIIISCLLRGREYTVDISGVCTSIVLCTFRVHLCTNTKQIQFKFSSLAK